MAKAENRAHLKKLQKDGWVIWMVADQYICLKKEGITVYISQASTPKAIRISNGPSYIESVSKKEIDTILLLARTTGTKSNVFRSNDKKHKSGRQVYYGHK